MLFLLFGLAVSVYVGQDACSTMTGSAANCAASGYCYHDGTNCVNLSCYLVNEVAACRSSPVGALSTVCDSLEQFSLQYDNVCVDKGDGKLNYAFVRFTKTTDGSVLSTSGSTTTPIATLTTTVTVDNMFPLYTLNPWKSPEGASNAATLKTELTSVINAYLAFYQILIETSNSHPFYLERTTYQALQLIRDYPLFPRADRITMITKIWDMAELALMRISRFSPSYYQTNYYFINFASVPYARKELKINGQLHTVRIDWIDYSYTANGFVQVYSYPAEQFGIRNALSDIIAIRPTTATATTAAMVLDTGFKDFYLEWTWTDTNLAVVPSRLQLYTFDETATPAVALVSGVAFTCVTSTSTCKSDKITTAPITTPTKRINYYITYGPGKCVDKNYVQCLLSIEQTLACTYTPGNPTDYKCA